MKIKNNDLINICMEMNCPKTAEIYLEVPYIEIESLELLKTRIKAIEVRLVGYEKLCEEGVLK